MPNVNDLYPSKWLAASDLQNRTIPVVIDRLNFEDVGDGEQKPVLYFQGKDKGLVLNKTNAMSISQIYGEETNGWIGQTIELFPAMVMFQGRNVPAIRLRPAQAPAAPAPVPPPPATEYQAPSGPPAPPPPPDDSDVPF